jgi:hypothetical protein
MTQGTGAISRATPIQLGLVVLCICGAFGGGAYITSIESHLSNIDDSLIRIEQVIKGRISRADMLQWIQRLKDKNPGANLDIPEFPK